MARDYMIGAYRGNGDERMARRLEDALMSLDEGISQAWMGLRDKAVHRLSVGNTHDSASVITGIFLPIWCMRAYTLRKKTNVWRGKLWSQSFFWETPLRHNPRARLREA